MISISSVSIKTKPFDPDWLRRYASFPPVFAPQDGNLPIFNALCNGTSGKPSYPHFTCTRFTQAKHSLVFLPLTILNLREVHEELLSG
jgi:hypothetical protein